MTCRVHYSLKIGSWTAQISLIMDPIFYYNSLQIWTKTHAVPLHDTQPMQHLSSWQHLEYIECMFIWGDIEGSYKILGQCRIHYGMKKATNIQHFAGSNFFLWFTWTVYTVCLSLRLIGYLYCATSFKSSGLISLGANKIFYWVLGESTIPQFQITFFSDWKYDRYTLNGIHEIFVETVTLALSPMVVLTYSILTAFSRVKSQNCPQHSTTKGHIQVILTPSIMLYMKVTLSLMMTNMSELLPFDVILASISPTNPSKAIGGITLYYQATAQISQSVQQWSLSSDLNHFSGKN